jgi:hypothetical protein
MSDYPSTGVFSVDENTPIELLDLKYLIIREKLLMEKLFSTIN